MSGATTLRPQSIDELRAAIASGGPLWLTGTESKSRFRLTPRSTGLSLAALAGIVQHDVDDQVVVVRAGTTIADLQSALFARGQCLPYPSALEPNVRPLLDGLPGTVGGMCAMNLPHAFQSQYGGPREWVLGMTVMRPDGSLAKSGSKAVKSVAGFDVHKLMTGARGTLGVIVEVILRTYPVKALRKGSWLLGSGSENGPVVIQRVLRCDFDRAVATYGKRLVAADPASSTIWAEAAPDFSIPSFRHDWVLRSGCGADNCRIHDPTLRELMLRAKRIYDPDSKLNAGEFGFL